MVAGVAEAEAQVEFEAERVCGCTVLRRTRTSKPRLMAIARSLGLGLGLCDFLTGHHVGRVRWEVRPCLKDTRSNGTLASSKNLEGSFLKRRSKAMNYSTENNQANLAFGVGRGHHQDTPKVKLRCNRNSK